MKFSENLISVEVPSGQPFLQICWAMVVGAPDVKWTSPGVEAVFVAGGISIHLQDPVIPMHALCDLISAVPVITLF